MKTTPHITIITLALLAIAAADAAHADAVRITDLLPGQIRITEVMPDPAKVSDARGEWFEIYNALGATIDLQGLVVRSKGSGSSSESFRVHSPAVLDADALFVFGRTPAPGENGGLHVDWAWGNGISLGNTNDFISLARPDGTTLAQVTWARSVGGISWEVQGGNPVEQVQADLVATGGTFRYGAGDVGTPGVFNSDMAALRNTVAAVPEPSTYAVIGTGLALLGLHRSRRRR